MWILKFIPDVVFYITLFLGLGVFAATSVIKLIPNKELIKAASALVVAVSIFFIGAAHDNNQWLARVQELEAKIAAAEQQSQEVNKKVTEKIVYKTQLVRERGSDITKYIDREVVKYDSTCVIPQPFVEAHNKAAEAPK